MHIALRPYMTTGVALVGASVIAVTPISPPPAAIESAAARVSSAAVELTAAFDPITAYTQLFTNTVNNLAGLGGEILADPAPLLRQVLTNSIGNAQILATSLQGVVTGAQTAAQGLPPAVQTAAGQLSEGNFAGAVDTLASYLLGAVLFQIGLPLITGPVQVAQNVVGNFNNVVQNGIIAVLLVALAPIYPINATISAFGALGQDILDSATNGDVIGAIGDVIAAPAVLADAFLNGFPDGISSFISPAGGLLTGGDVGFGTIENILQAKKSLAGLLTLPAPTTTSVTTASDRLVTLDVASDPKTGTVVEDKSGQDTAGTDAASDESSDATKTKSSLKDRLTKRANGATGGSSAESSGTSSTQARGHRPTGVVGGVRDKLTTKRDEGSGGLRSHVGKTSAANSGGNGSSDSGHADSGGAAK